MPLVITIPYFTFLRAYRVSSLEISPKWETAIKSTDQHKTHSEQSGDKLLHHIPLAKHHTSCPELIQWNSNKLLRTQNINAFYLTSTKVTVLKLNY
jgi:hypothetical protein